MNWFQSSSAIADTGVSGTFIITETRGEDITHSAECQHYRDSPREESPQEVRESGTRSTPGTRDQPSQGNVSERLSDGRTSFHRCATGKGGPSIRGVRAQPGAQ